MSNVFDSNLRRTSLDIKNGSTVLQAAGYAYDSAGRLQTVTDNSATAYTVTYAYETNSPLVSSIIAKSNTTVRLTTRKAYDKLNRLQSISSSNSVLPSPISFAKIAHEDGSYWLYQYDALGQVTSGRKYWGDGTPVDGQQFEYGFDEIGNRTVTGGRASSQSLYTVNRQNQYSSRTNSPLLDIFGIANPTANVTVGVNGGTAYNANRKGEYFHYPLNVGNNVYPQIDSISLYGGHQTQSGKEFVPPATETYYYDKDGNLTNDGRWTFYWDGENRLTNMTSLSSAPNAASKYKLEFAYDYQGRRIQKIVSTNNGSAYYPLYTNRFIYDGWNLVGELDGGNSNAKLRSYIWGTDLSGSMQGAGGVGGLVKVSEYIGGGTNHYFAAYDGNGNLAGLVDGSTGGVTARYEYGPFGEALRATGTFSTNNPVRFSSKFADNESGMVYYGYRYYAAGSGTWINRDPSDEQGGLNLVGFNNNNPISFYDELGEALGGKPKPPTPKPPTPKPPGPPNPADQSLSLKSIKGPVPGNCGDVTWDTKWLLSKNSVKGGVVIQKVINTWFVYDSSTGKETDTGNFKSGVPYWEAWQIPPGADRTQNEKDDVFAWSGFLPWGGSGTGGKVSKTGEARFYEGITSLPSSFIVNNPATGAGFLASTTTDPNLTKGTAAVRHVLKIHWNCCGKPKKTSVDSHIP